LTEALRNLGRRKLRSGLTIFGITIGIFALSVMGSLSEFLNQTVDSGIRYTGSIVRVLPKNSVTGIGVVRESEGEKFKTLAHVKEVTGFLVAPAEDTTSVGFSTKQIQGLDPAVAQDIFGTVPLADGRMLTSGDDRKVVLGQQVAASAGLKVSEETTFRDYKVTVVGIFKPTQNPQIDNVILAPLKNVQELAATPGIVSAFAVVPDNPSNADLVADEINKAYPKQFNALNPTELKKQVQQGVLIFNIIILAGAALAAVVGGFATINTMIMSVAERTREIGIKKAVGASNNQIMFEFLVESALMGFLGGALGVAIGKVATLAINSYTKTNVSGLEIFDLTPRLALLALAFATGLGAFAGLIPAFSAARMNIVRALRTE
jgi:putative ABC transport system permease protein